MVGGNRKNPKSISRVLEFSRKEMMVAWVRVISEGQVIRVRFGIYRECPAFRICRQIGSGSERRDVVKDGRVTGWMEASQLRWGTHRRRGGESRRFGHG